MAQYGLMQRYRDDNPGRPSRDSDNGPRAPISGPASGFGSLRPPVALPQPAPFPPVYGGLPPGMPPPWAIGPGLGLPGAGGGQPPMVGVPRMPVPPMPVISDPNVMGPGGPVRGWPGAGGTPQLPAGLDLQRLLPFLLQLYG